MAEWEQQGEEEEAAHMGWLRALYDYEPGGDGEIALKEGDLVALLSADDPDWWEGDNNGVTVRSSLRRHRLWPSPLSP